MTPMKAAALSVAFALGGASVAGAEPLAPDASAIPPASADTPSLAPAEPGPDPVEAALLGFGAFHFDMAAVQAQRFTATGDVDQALDRVAAHSEASLTRGFIAYGATIAAQTPAFADEVKQVAAAYGPEVAARAFAMGGQYARGLRGGEEAAQRILAMAQVDGGALVAAGERIESEGARLGAVGWAKTRVPARTPAREGRLRQLFSTVQAPTPPQDMAGRLLAMSTAPAVAYDSAALGGANFWEAARTGAEFASAVSYRPAAAFAPEPTKTPVIDAMMSLAALKVMGLRHAPDGAVETLLTHQPTNYCFEMARREFINCVGANDDAASLVACLGKSGLQNRGQCMASLVDDTPPAQTAAVALPLQAATSVSE